MKKLLVVAMLLGVGSVGAVAQPAAPPRTFTLTVTLEEANLILEQLASMPWKAANPTLQKLLGQLQAQQGGGAQPPAPPAEAPK